jgi:hypothetical protein
LRPSVQRSRPDHEQLRSRRIFAISPPKRGRLPGATYPGFVLRISFSAALPRICQPPGIGEGGDPARQPDGGMRGPRSILGPWSHRSARRQRTRSPIISWVRAKVSEESPRTHTDTHGWLCPGAVVASKNDHEGHEESCVVRSRRPGLRRRLRRDCCGEAAIILLRGLRGLRGSTFFPCESVWVRGLSSGDAYSRRDARIFPVLADWTRITDFRAGSDALGSL